MGDGEEEGEEEEGEEEGEEEKEEEEERKEEEKKKKGGEKKKKKKRTITKEVHITFEQYQTISNLLVLILRKKEEVDPSFDGVEQQECINEYLQHTQIDTEVDLEVIYLFVFLFFFSFLKLCCYCCSSYFDGVVHKREFLSFSLPPSSQTNKPPTTPTTERS